MPNARSSEKSTRRAKSPARKRQARVRARQNPCRVLILIDATPIRAEALARYDKLEQQITKTREALDRFYSQDEPAYRHWLHKTFGAHLSKLQALRAEEHNLQHYLDCIDYERFRTQCSEVEAYRRVMARIAAGEDPAGVAEPDAPDEEGAAPDEEDFDTLEALFPAGELDQIIDRYLELDKLGRQAMEDEFDGIALTFEIATGREAPTLAELAASRRTASTQSSEKRPSDRPHHKSPAKEKPEYARLYRQIAKRLHPDSAGELTALQRELWHEAQDAYQATDASRLSAVLARLEMAGAQSVRSLSVSAILGLIRDLKRLLSGARAQTRNLKQDPAWGFSKRKNTKRVELDLREHFEDAIEQLDWEVEELRFALETLKRRAARVAKSSVRKRIPSKNTASGKRQRRTL